MAKAAEVQRRIERALDDTREIPKPWTARRWLALAACAVPVLWLAAVAQLAPATAQEAPRAGADVAAAERAVAANPNDLAARLKLVIAYYDANLREPRLAQIYWMISNHPEASQTVFASRGLTPRDSALNTAADFERAAGLWKQAATAHLASPAVVRNAADFLTTAGRYQDAEQLVLNARREQPTVNAWDSPLARIYATAILAAAGDPKFPNGDATFAGHARSELESSESRPLLTTAGMLLSSAARRPQPGETLQGDVLNLDEHPLLAPAVELGHQLLDRAGVHFSVAPSGVVTMGARKGDSRPPSGGVLGGIISSVPGGGAPPPPPPGVSGGVPGGVLGGVVGSTSAPNAADSLPPAPPVLRRIEPAYPPLALQARIAGIVKLRVTLGSDGSVEHIEVASGHPLLVPSAIEALKEWKFQPSGPGPYRVEIPFTLMGSSPAPAPALAPGQTPIVAIGPNVQASKLVNHVDPVYPPAARAAGVEGVVTLRIIIDENGAVVSMDPSDGNPALASAAMAAVRQWTYQPTLFNGQPVKVVTTVTVPFKL